MPRLISGRERSVLPTPRLRPGSAWGSGSGEQVRVKPMLEAASSERGEARLRNGGDLSQRQEGSRVQVH